MRRYFRKWKDKLECDLELTVLDPQVSGYYSEVALAENSNAPATLRIAITEYEC